MIQRSLGVVLLLLATLLFASIAYGLFVEQPHAVRDRSLWPPVVTTAVLTSVGIFLLRSPLWLTWDRVFRPVFGVLAILFGLSILVWTGYNLVIERLPEGGEGRPVILSTSVILIAVGARWLFPGPRTGPRE